MAGLRARCNDCQILQPLGLAHRRARANAIGAFADFVGEVEEMVSNDCVRLLFELMGQTTRVDAAGDQKDLKLNGLPRNTSKLNRVRRILASLGLLCWPSARQRLY